MLKPSPRGLLLCIYFAIFVICLVDFSEMPRDFSVRIRKRLRIVKVLARPEALAPLEATNNFSVEGQHAT